MSSSFALQGMVPANAGGNSTGKQGVPSTGTSTLMASITTEGVDSVGISGWVTTGALSDLLIAIASEVTNGTTNYEDTGRSVPVLVGSAGDFATATSFLTLCSLTPHTTAAGAGFVLHLALKGKVARVDVYAKSTTAGTVLTIDAMAQQVGK